MLSSVVSIEVSSAGELLITVITRILNMLMDRFLMHVHVAVV